MSSPQHRARSWSLLALGYLGLALLISWPLALNMGDALLGTATMDQVDTAWLRLAAGRLLTGAETGAFAPVGYPIAAVIPNWVDHLLGAPLALLLPWPLADNLFWLLLIAANGLAGHALGRQLGGGHGAGALCGVGFALAEPVLREINASHAPQALLLFSPLFLLWLLRALSANGRVRDGLLAGIALALSALTYWYQGLFLGLLALPVVAHGLLRAHGAGSLRVLAPRVGAGLGLALALCAAPLALAVGAAPELAGVGETALQHIPGARGLPVPAEHAWTFLHGSGPEWLWRSEPIASACRLSPVLLAAAVAGSLRGDGPRWPWWLAAGLGGLLLMGPFLQWQGEAVRIGSFLVPLPGYLLAELSDGYARLHWPLRWAVVVPLALLPLAARAPRPWIWAGVLLLETLLLSGNAPLQVAPVDGFAGWSGLSSSPGPVLVLPQESAADGPSTMGLIYRAGGAPLANELGVPPRAAQPIAFRAWQEDLALRGWWRERQGGGDEPVPAGAVPQLEREGVAAVALDLSPGGAVPPARSLERAQPLIVALGEPVDLGSAWVWWIEAPVVSVEAMPDAQAWRERRHDELVAAGWQRGRP